MDETQGLAQTAAAPATPTESSPAEVPASEPEIAVTSDGEVMISDSLWEEPEKPAQPEQDAQSEGDNDVNNAPPLSSTPLINTQQPTPPTQPVMYTDEELRETPFEQWDETRISGDVSRYIPFFKEQLARRRAQAEFVARHNAQALAAPQQNAPQMPQAPQPYTPKELSEAAVKLARERLKLDDDDEFDMYEPEHFAAMQQATGELQAARREEIAKFQHAAQGQEQFGRFWADMSARADINDFNNWATETLIRNGQRPEMIADYIKNTGDYAGGIQAVNMLYQGYLASKRQAAQNIQNGRINNRVPAVENAANAVNTGGRKFDLSKLGEMNDDQQQQAFIDSGFMKLFMS